MDVIDLHIISNGVEFPLQYQLDRFEFELDNALFRGLSEFRVIHGIGEGILKKEINKILKSHPHILSYNNDFHPLYGMGSTKIVFK